MLHLWTQTFFFCTITTLAATPGFLQEVGHFLSTVSLRLSHPHPFWFFTHTDTHAKPQARIRIDLACGYERQKQKKGEKKRMEGRTEDKKGEEKKTRVSHGHTQWSNVPHKASRTQKHKPTLTPLTHTHTRPELHRAPPGRGMQGKSDGCALACESRSCRERQR